MLKVSPLSFEALTARLETEPFQNGVAGRVFPQPAEAIS
jgi:hypothetical protein